MKVYGIGINDSVVENRDNLIYSLWRGMLKRCYSEKYKAKNPTYKDCTVCQEWHTYSKFEVWVKNFEYIGMELDKDLLVKGNKVYSPTTCILIPHAVNTFINNRNTNGLLDGVSICKQTGKYTARVSNPFTGVRENLGRSENELYLHELWKKRKLELSKMLVVKFNLPEEVLTSLINRYT